MRTDRPATPGPPLSPHLNAGRVAAPQPRSLAAAAVSQCAGAAGHLAPHGAAGLAEDRVLLLPVQVPGGARRAGEGAPGQEWQKLNYDIYTLRQIRREVRNRWKRILEDLGFQKEADSLLSVTKLSTISDSKNTRKAREILLKLAEETSIFPTSWELSERYLFVVDRLIALDAAEEFFKIASRTYPKKPGVPSLADGQKELHYLPFPSP
ncbi:melanoregulin isoform X2 [Lutra lutra]|uniref:melanoregulin isoform X2 n=1 Tax=Lutra lutra TaxID=9657 RepID=UPI001FD15F96|nr:melanoregulin isoform X2 [Lutra lutra]